MYHGSVRKSIVLGKGRMHLGYLKFEVSTGHLFRFCVGNRAKDGWV